MCSSELDVKRSLQNSFDFTVKQRYLMWGGGTFYHHRAIRTDRAYEILKWQYMQTFTCKDVYQNVGFLQPKLSPPGDWSKNWWYHTMDTTWLLKMKENI